MLRDPTLQAAVSRIVQRSERHTDVGKLVGTYVDVGLLPQLHNTNHQIFYGRRGTGKTHVTKVLESALKSDSRVSVVYIDCRTLGSTSQFSDQNVPMPRRCLALFRDFLLAIYHGLLEHIVEHPSHHANKALLEADQLCVIITEPLASATPDRIATETRDNVSRSAQYGLQIDLNSPLPKASLNAKSQLGNDSGTMRRTEYAIKSEDKIVFPDLQRSLASILKLADTQLYVLVDEWSSLPPDVQPYLAEFLKRGILPLPNATLKISALEYRCRFTDDSNSSFIGFELGADIATAPDLDDYFVYDRNPEQITDVYSDMLLKHLASELPNEYLANKHGVTTGKQLASRLFTERATCAELARASEGVIRDLINIFTKAFFDSQRRERKSIDKQSILNSARQWFEQDKANYLDDELQRVLRAIVDNVIGQRRARSFLLPRELEKNSTIQRLFDARVLHHMQRGYADKDNPGIRYNIYSIDYGAYVDLLGTSREPDHDLLERDDSDIVVPFDDKRSIRRIILQADILEA